MDFSASAALQAAPEHVLAAVADLGTCSDWLGIVAAAAPAAPHTEDPGPAWNVTLEARLGPLVRRKRLRMVRTGPVPNADADGPVAVRFERMEHDGARHGAWLLTATVSPFCEDPQPEDGDTSSQNEGVGAGRDPRIARTLLEIGLHYGGAGWVPGLDRILAEQARRSATRLDALLSG